jgi:hypothetical protein
MLYNSINEREIGTTFVLRAQDAIGWNPRSFRFLLNPADFRYAQQLFRSTMATTTDRSANGTNNPKAPGGPAFSRLVELRQHTVFTPD